MCVCMFIYIHMCVCERAEEQCGGGHIAGCALRLCHQCVCVCYMYMCIYAFYKCVHLDVRVYVYIYTYVCV